MIHFDNMLIMIISAYGNMNYFLNRFVRQM